MRKIAAGLVVIVGCGGGSGGGTKPLAPTDQPVAGKPCPADTQALVEAQYRTDDADPARPREKVVVDACQWGKFVGNGGWLVFHHRPWPPGSHAEVDPDSGIAFVDASGKVVASRAEGYVGKLVVTPIDLDGDGTDEALVRYSWSAYTPTSGTDAVVLGVEGDKIETYGRQRYEYTRDMDPRFVCKASLATESHPTKPKHLVLAIVMPEFTGDHDQGDCLAPGKHRFRLSDKQLVELEDPAL
jgi:hypothetical protein